MVYEPKKEQERAFLSDRYSSSLYVTEDINMYKKSFGYEIKVKLHSRNIHTKIINLQSAVN